MREFLNNGLLGLVRGISVTILFLGVGQIETRASVESTKEMEAWLAEVERVLTDSVSSSSGFLGGLSGLVATAQEKDERHNVLQAHIEVIKARTKAGRSWPDPELRLGYEEEDWDDQTSRKAAIRFRLPERADRRLLEKISHVDIDWTHERIQVLREKIALRVKQLYTRGLFARLSILSGANRLKELLDQERQLRVLKESGQASAIEEARLVIEELKLYRSLRSDYTTFESTIEELVSFGIEDSQAHAALQSGDWLQLLVEQLPPLDRLVTIAVRNSEDTLRYEREDAMLAIRLDEVKRSWLPSPSFFQIEWGDRKEGGNSNRENEWGALAGFTFDLFNDHEDELLLSMRREADLNRKMDLQELEREVKTSYSEFQSVLNSYHHYEVIWNPAIASIETLLEESALAGGDPTDLWKIREDLYDLESESVEMRWVLIETLLEFESTIGQILSNG